MADVLQLSRDARMAFGSKLLLVTVSRVPCDEQARARKGEFILAWC